MTHYRTLLFRLSRVLDNSNTFLVQGCSSAVSVLQTPLTFLKRSVTYMFPQLLQRPICSAVKSRFVGAQVQTLE